VVKIRAKYTTRTNKTDFFDRFPTNKRKSSNQNKKCPLRIRRKNIFRPLCNKRCKKRNFGRG
jgi:hypothetical protein